VIQAKGEDSAFQYLKNLNKQAKTYASSWSSSYGLFKKSQVLTTFSYATSPVYHLLQEQDSTVVAAEFVEGHPVQYEYLAIPKSCKQCDLAKRFSELMLSPEGQKVIMEKNYMFPVVAGVKDGTAFGNVPPMKTISMLVPSASEKERILKRWSQLRRQD
jgi:thiamine transport system substrate-binding protein